MKNPFTREHYVAAAKMLGELFSKPDPLSEGVKLTQVVPLFDSLFSNGKPTFNKPKFHNSIHEAIAAARRADSAPKECQQ